MDLSTVLLRQEEKSGDVVKHQINLSDSEEDTKYFISRLTDIDDEHLVITPSWPLPNHGLAVLHVSKKFILLEALSDHVSLRFRSWTSISDNFLFAFTPIPRTENDRQTLIFLRPDDVFSVGAVHFRFQHPQSPAAEAFSDFVQVESSDHRPLAVDEAQVVAQDNTYTVNMSTMYTEPTQASIANLVPVTSMIKESDNTVSGFAITPSFPEVPLATYRSEEEAEGDDQGSQRLPMNIADSIEIGAASSQRWRAANIGDGIADAMDEGHPPSLNALITEANEQEMGDASVDSIIDKVMDQDHAIDFVARATQNSASIPQVSSTHLNCRPTLTATADDIIIEGDRFRRRSKDLDKIHNGENAHRASFVISDETSSQVITLTPAATNPQAQLAGIAVVPPIRSAEVYEEMSDQESEVPQDHKKSQIGRDSPPGEMQYDSTRSTIYKQSKSSQRKRKMFKQQRYSKKSRNIIHSSESESVSRQSRDTTSQTSPEVSFITSPLQAHPSPTSSSISSQKSRGSNGICIFFASSTTIRNLQSIKEFLKAHMIRTARSIETCTHFCVSSKFGLKKTGNLVKAVMKGKEVVTDRWLTASAKAGALLDTGDFIPHTPVDWDISLQEAVLRGRRGVRVLSGLKIFFTENARDSLGISGYEDVREIALAAGAVEARCVKRDRIKGGESASGVIYVASGNDDVDWHHCLLEGLTVYTRDIMLMSVLRGDLDLESDEFMVGGSITGCAPMKGKDHKDHKEWKRSSS